MKVQLVGYGVLALCAVNLVPVTGAFDGMPDRLAVTTPALVEPLPPAHARPIPDSRVATISALHGVDGAIAAASVPAVPTVRSPGAMAHASAPGSYFGIDHYLADRLEPVAEPVGHP